MKKKTLICKQAGATFQIPIEDEFIKGMKPSKDDEPEDENGLEEDERQAAWSQFMYEQQLLDRENNY